MAFGRCSSPARPASVHSLTCGERLTLFDAWADAGPANGLAVIGHVGGNSRRQVHEPRPRLVSPLPRRRRRSLRSPVGHGRGAVGGTRHRGTRWRGIDLQLGAAALQRIGRRLYTRRPRRSPAFAVDLHRDDRCDRGDRLMGTAKALMCRLGVPVGPARAPLSNPTPAQVDALISRLDNLGFGRWGAWATGQ